MRPADRIGQVTLPTDSIIAPPVGGCSESRPSIRAAMARASSSPASNAGSGYPTPENSGHATASCVASTGSASTSTTGCLRSRAVRARSAESPSRQSTVVTDHREASPSTTAMPPGWSVACCARAAIPQSDTCKTATLEPLRLPPICGSACVDRNRYLHSRGVPRKPVD